jgi:hypothetical protein
MTTSQLGTHALDSTLSSEVRMTPKTYRSTTRTVNQLSTSGPCAATRSFSPLLPQPTPKSKWQRYLTRETPAPSYRTETNPPHFVPRAQGQSGLFQKITGLIKYIPHSDGIACGDPGAPTTSTRTPFSPSITPAPKARAASFGCR